MTAPTAEERLATMERIVKDQASTIEALKAPKGIRSARPNEKPAPKPWTTEQKAELELRRYIKNAGARVKGLGGEKHAITKGFYKNLPAKDRERAVYLMKEVLHRTTKSEKDGKERLNMVWDETILDFKNHEPVEAE